MKLKKEDKAAYGQKRRELLKDALLRAVQAAEIIGCRAVSVQAKDDDAKAFYQRFGFEEAPNDPFRLYLLMKDVKATLQQCNSLGHSG